MRVGEWRIGRGIGYGRGGYRYDRAAEGRGSSEG